MDYSMDYTVNKSYSDTTTTPAMDLFKNIYPVDYIIMPDGDSRDLKQATDAVVAFKGKSRKYTIGMRGRSYGWYERFWMDISIRMSRSGGIRTEYQKIVEDGHMDIMYYYHMSNDDNVDQYYILNINLLRDNFINYFKRARRS